MDTTVIFLSGEAKFVELDKPDEKFGRYSLNLYPDEASWQKFEEVGLQLKVRDDSREPEKKFIKLYRVKDRLVKGKVVVSPPPPILQADNTPYKKPPQIGNGSNVTCKVEVIDTPKGKGHRLLSVRVNSLVDPPQRVIDASNEESPF